MYMALAARDHAFDHGGISMRHAHQIDVKGFAEIIRVRTARIHRQINPGIGDQQPDRSERCFNAGAGRLHLGKRADIGRRYVNAAFDLRRYRFQSRRPARGDRHRPTAARQLNRQRFADAAAGASDPSAAMVFTGRNAGH